MIEHHSWRFPVKKLLFFLIAAVSLTGLAQEQTVKETYKQSVDRWHEGRINGLKRDHGWLSLIALDCLKPGINKVAGIGMITIAGDSLVLALTPGANGMLNGKNFSTGRILPDQDKVFFGTKAVALIHRGEKYAVRVWDSETPARKNFTGIDRFPVDEQWKITAEWVPYPTPKKVVIPTVIPELTQEGIAPGIAVFTLKGKECKLEPTVEEGSDQLFFVFGDKTNGKSTYGAGRFLYTDMPKDGKVVLDFNKSYNPPCVFTDFATCPVPIPQNRMPVSVEAGEKNFKSH
jgi:uncharacterized protein (DUF1684 family)